MPKVIVIPDEGMSDEDKEYLKSRFALPEDAPGAPCRWCGGLHQRECPRVKKIIFNPGDQRQIREVEFWADGEWDKSSIAFPEDAV